MSVPLVTMIYVRSTINEFKKILTTKNNCYYGMDHDESEEEKLNYTFVRFDASNRYNIQARRGVLY